MVKVRMMPSTGDGKKTEGEFRNRNIETDDVATKVRKAAEKSAAGFAAGLGVLSTSGDGSGMAAGFELGKDMKENKEAKAKERKRRLNNIASNT